MSVNLRTVVPAVLLATAAGVVAAQPSGNPPAAQRNAASGDGATPAEPVSSPPSNPANAAMGYRSAFDGYRRFSEQPVGSWREANDLVRRIGGWQAYAREAQGAPAADNLAAPKTPAAPGAASAATSGGHSGPKKP